MNELENPFRPGAGTQPPALLGRDALIQRFQVTIRRAVAGKPGKSLVVIGLRGVGKTVLLARFGELAEAEGVALAHLEAPEGGRFMALLAGALRKVLLRMRSGVVSATIQKALRVLRSFTLQLPDGGQVSVDVEPLAGFADSGRLPDDLTDLFVAIGEAARERQSGVLVVIDEIQYLSGEELAAVITAIHRCAQLDLPLVVVGAGLPQLPGLAGEAKSYAERLFDFPEVGSLSQADARAAIAFPCRDAGVEVTDAALDQIAVESNGYPYFLQEWGYHTWNAADGSPVTIGDVLAATPLVERHLDKNFFRVRFDRLTPREKDYLRAMARLGPGPHRSGDIAAVLKVKVETVAPRRAILIQKGMIYSPAHGDTAFTVPLFDQFLKRTA